VQIDLEMAFADGESVMARMEKFIVDIYTSLQGEGLTQTRLPRAPFPRMTYNRAMNRHGVDKPDLRIKNFVSNPYSL
jgi:aspartyl-tRNA synthetase